MYTYPMNTNYEAIETVVAQLTAKGRETMRAVGAGELSYFDEGIVEYSGIWGECLTGEMGHKSSGVINRLRDLGLWTVSDGEVNTDESMWWALTALGADVANYLAGRLQNQADAETQMAEELPAEEPKAEQGQVTVKKGAKWTYLYAADGTLIAELRNDQFEAIAQHLVNGQI